MAIAAKQRDRLSSELAFAESKMKSRKAAPLGKANGSTGGHDDSALLALRLKLIAKENQVCQWYIQALIG